MKNLSFGLFFFLFFSLLFTSCSFFVSDDFEDEISSNKNSETITFRGSEPAPTGCHATIEKILGSSNYEIVVAKLGGNLSCSINTPLTQVFSFTDEDGDGPHNFPVPSVGGRYAFFASTGTFVKIKVCDLNGCKTFNLTDFTNTGDMDCTGLGCQGL